MSDALGAALTAEGLSPWAGVGNPTLALWVRRRQRAQELKQMYEGEWQKYWRWYRAFNDPLSDPGDWWRSNEVIPTVFKVVETLIPRYILGMFESPDWFSVEARQRRDEGYEQMCESLLRATVEEMKLFPKMYEAMKYATIMGHAWGKVVWREEYTDRQVMRPTQEIDETTGQPRSGVQVDVITEEDYNNVDFEWRPLDRIFADPTGEGQWFVEEIDSTLERLVEAQDKMNGTLYDKEELAKLIAGLPPSRAAMAYGGGDSLTDARRGTSAGVSVEYSREPQVTEGIPNEYVSPMRDGIGLKLWQCWGWVPPALRKKDKAAWRLTVIAEGKYIIRDEPSPTPDGKPPYFPIKSIPIPGRLYGESIIRYVGPLSDQQTRLANMRLDEVYLGVWQQYLYKKGALAGDNMMLFQPGGAIPVMPDPGMNVSDTFVPLPRPTVLPEHYTEDQYRQQQAEHAAAASDVMQGVSEADRQTATETQIKLQQGNARHMLQVLWNDYTVKKELLERTWKWLQMRLTKPKFVRTVGEEYAPVDLEQIQVPIDIVVSGGMFAMSKNERQQMSQELVQMAGSPAFTQWMKMGAILRRYLMDRGWKNPEAYAKTDQEVMLEAILQQMGPQALQAAGMAGQAGAQQGAEGGGGEPPTQDGGPDGGATPSETPESDVSNMPLAGDQASMGGGPIADAGPAGPSIS